MNSFNHFSLGAIYEWMMGYHLGIMCDEEKPGYKHFILQPQMGGTMTYAMGTFESPYGLIKSGWTRHEDGLWDTYTAVVPTNTTTDLYLPAEREREVCGSEGVTYEGRCVHQGLETYHFKMRSGSYRFANEEGKIVVNYSG